VGVKAIGASLTIWRTWERERGLARMSALDDYQYNREGAKDAKADAKNSLD